MGARVLGADWPFPHCLPVHRLVHHRSLAMVEFYLILSAVQPDIGVGMFWRLLIGTIAMLAFGYCGEASFINAWPAFILGLCGWFFILFEIFMGGASKVCATGDK